MLQRFIRRMIGRLPFAKQFYGWYVARQADAKVSKGTTAMNVLETFPAFVANGWGLYKPRAGLTIKSVNQTIPALLAISRQQTSDERENDTIAQFSSGYVEHANADRLKMLLESYGSDKASRHDYYQAYARILVLPGFQWQGSRGLRSSLPQKNRIRVL